MARRKTRLRVIPLGGLDEIGKNMTVLEYGPRHGRRRRRHHVPRRRPPRRRPRPARLHLRRASARTSCAASSSRTATRTTPAPCRTCCKRPGPPRPGHLGVKLTLGLIQGKLEEAGIKKPDLRQVARRRDGRRWARFTLQLRRGEPLDPGRVRAAHRHARSAASSTRATSSSTRRPIDGRATDYAALAEAGSRRRPAAHERLDQRRGRGLHAPRGRGRAGRCSGIFDDGRPARSSSPRSRATSTGSSRSCDAARRLRPQGRRHRALDDPDRRASPASSATCTSTTTSIVDAYELEDLAPRASRSCCRTGQPGRAALGARAHGQQRAPHGRRSSRATRSSSRRRRSRATRRPSRRVINKLFRAGAEVVHRALADVHVSGPRRRARSSSSCSRWSKPRYFMPVHGETPPPDRARASGRARRACRTTTSSSWTTATCLELIARRARSVTEHVEAGVVYVDGLGVGDVGHVVLRDRQHMANDGIAMIVVTIDAARARSSASPSSSCAASRSAEGDDELLDEATRPGRQDARADREGTRHRLRRVIKNALRESLSQFIWERVRRRPLDPPRRDGGLIA